MQLRNVLNSAFYYNSVRFRMGVFKLWELLLTVAQPYNIQQLAGKIVAIDASIWIVKIDTIFSDNNEKIKSILSKIMLMKKHNILPIFVFDGTPPALKRKTLEERARKRLVASDLEAKKKSEIEIMRMIEGESGRQSQKNRKKQESQQQLKEVNTRLQMLSAYSKNQQDVSKEVLQKIALQSQILNTKYKIMLDLLPEYKHYEHFLPLQLYQLLDLQSKSQYLDQLEEFKWRHLKNLRKKHKQENMSQEQKLRWDLQIIEKKSIVREMQDNLFRKMMQKNMKIENGYEIIQTIYNGKTMIQKRKIKDQNDSNRTGFGFRKAKSKNDFSKISFAEEKDSEAEAEIDPFVSSFCDHSEPSKNVSTLNTRSFNQQEKQQDKQQRLNDVKLDDLIKVKEVKPSKIKQSLHPKQKVVKQPKKKKPKLESNNLNSDQSQPYIPFVHYGQDKQEQPEMYVNLEQFHQKYTASQNQSMNRDNLPNFRSQQHPEYLNSSNDNLQLQNLFTILGLPYLIAPGQAEAQCAALQQEGIVDGIITEDSDIFLFGGKNVFRGLFNNNIRCYSSKAIQEKLKLNRQKLIIFAELLGSDYTEGVKGIGLVNAMEILKVFNTFDKLQKFKKWAEHPDVLLPDEQTTDQLLKNANQEEKQFYELHKRYKNYWYIGQSFGNKNIHNAYLRPDILKREHIQRLKQNGVFAEKDIKGQLLIKLLKDRLQLQGNQFEHYMRILTLKYNNKRPNTLLNYFSRNDGANQETQFARIKSRRLQKSLQSQQNGD